MPIDDFKKVTDLEVSLSEFKRAFVRSWPHNRISIAYS